MMGHGEPRARLYARSDDHLGAAHQLQALRGLAKARGWAVGREYLDRGPHASNPRPDFERLLGDVRCGGGGVVVANSLATLFTSQRQAVLVMRDLAARGFDLVVPADGIDSTAKCEFGTMMSALASLDRAALREKIGAGLAEARRLGKPIGRKRVEVPVAQAQALLDQGRSLREVGRALGVAPSTLHRALRQGRAPHHQAVPLAFATALQEAA